MAQRDAPHLEGAVFQQQGVLGRVDLGPRDGVGQLRVEVPEVAGQNLAEGRRGEDPERVLRPYNASVEMSGNSPKTWSPWRCEMNTARIFSGLTP